MTYKVMSLFSGCGGLDLGFKDQGFDLIYACDFDPIAVECYKRNIDHRSYVRDVREEAFRQDILSINSADVVVGGFPCQGFSKAGPKRTDDSRNFLYLEMKFAIDHLRPKIFIAENVDGLSQNFKGRFLDQIVSDFRKIGYNVHHDVIDAISYGVAQHRRRIFFVGIRQDLPQRFKWPAPTHQQRIRNGDKKYQESIFNLFQEPSVIHPYRTIADEIGDLVELDNRPDHCVTNRWPQKYNHIFKKIKAGQKLCNCRHAETSVYTWDIPEVFGKVSELQEKILITMATNRRHKVYGHIPNGNPLSIEVIERLSGLSNIQSELTDLLEKGYIKDIDGKYDLKGAMFASGLFKRPNWNEPCPTVLTNFHNPRYFLHPIANRPFSARECARLQGFPDTFHFSWEDYPVPLEDRYRLIGNAVAVPVSRLMAGAVKEFLFEEGKTDYEIQSGPTNITRKVV